MKIVFDYSKLLGKIKEIFNSQAAFARALGLSESALSQRLTNKVDFSQEEILSAVNLLGINRGHVAEYFFTPKVRKTKQKEAYYEINSKDKCN